LILLHLKVRDFRWSAA